MNSIKSILLLFFTLPVFSQSSQFINPILPGGYPDPSICRVGDTFYLVNSTFEYFPALPIHKSKDLVNWELIGYGLDRPDQGSGAVNLIDVQQNGGIHAPSIRYNKGTFYIIVTNVYSPAEGLPGEMVNFIITATDPAGPWSEPHVIEGAPGIDPDLFFDDDGKVYFVGTHDVDRPEANGIGEIWVQQLDLEDWKLVGQRASIWKGACGGCCVEGPHMYKVNGNYYLMVAEGGTSHNHAVMIAVSPNLIGPYESNPRNPIFTSRHLSLNNWVHSTGHADLVELEDGRWYMVALGIRNESGGGSNMGRETFLMPVIWEPITVRWAEVSPNNWQPVLYDFPVVAPETGKVERLNPLPFPEKSQHYNDSFNDDFDSDKLDLAWNFRRVPLPNLYSLTANKGHLRLNLHPDSFALRGRYGAIGFRQKETDFDFSVKMSFKPKNNFSEAGISLFQQDDNYIAYTIVKTPKGYDLKLKIKPREVSEIHEENIHIPNYKGEIVFKVVARLENYKYSYSIDGGKTFQLFTETASDLVLCKGYIGTYLGLYASSNGTNTKEFADYDWVNYSGFVRL